MTVESLAVKRFNDATSIAAIPPFDVLETAAHEIKKAEAEGLKLTGVFVAILLEDEHGMPIDTYCAGGPEVSTKFKIVGLIEYLKRRIWGD